MSKPEIHTFGLAQYVYASAYENLKAENANLRATLREVTNALESACSVVFNRIGVSDEYKAETTAIIAKARSAQEGGGA
tara:strand:+ start:115 stop:351 length:237 start_codon:yes stop_codon:yes gene_type:complete